MLDIHPYGLLRPPLSADVNEASIARSLLKRGGRRQTSSRGESVRLLAGMLLAALILSVPTALAVPQINVECSTSQIRKGEPFKVYVQISPQEDIQNIDLKWIPPTGFELTLDKDNENYPREMVVGSSYTFAFSGTPPPALKKLGYGPGQDTRERKIFIFNVDYSVEKDGRSEKHQQTVRLERDFSINGLVYLAIGTVGLLLGSVIKKLTRYGAEHQQAAQSTPQERPRGPLLIDLLSVTAIGFVVLLVLSREAIPTKGFYDSLALGVAVAILSDDQLLTKVRSLVPKAA